MFISPKQVIQNHSLEYKFNNPGRVRREQGVVSGICGEIQDLYTIRISGKMASL